MKIHETLPNWIQYFIKSEKINIFYLNLQNLLWMLCNKNIWVNTKLNLYKKRFIICHELWHYIFGWDLDFVWVPHWKNPYEKIADEFALDILLPREKLLEEFKNYEWDLYILEKIFWVEKSLIEKRILNLMK